MTLCSETKIRKKTQKHFYITELIALVAVIVGEGMLTIKLLSIKALYDSLAWILFVGAFSSVSVGVTLVFGITLLQQIKEELEEKEDQSEVVEEVESDEYEEEGDWIDQMIEVWD